MRHHHLVLLAVIPLAAGACAQVLGLDEPTVKGDGGGDTTTSAGPQSGATSGTSSSTGATGAGGDGGGAGPGGGTAGGGGSSPCTSDQACDDDDVCTVDLCADGTCSNEPSGVQPEDDGEDCVDVVCDGGVATTVPDDSEDPPDAAAPCLLTVCLGGVPTDLPADAGTICGPSPLECDGTGVCVGCTVDVQCGAPTACAVPRCNADGTCDPGFVEEGTIVDDEPGNCEVTTCTGVSAVPVTDYDPADLPEAITCAVVSCTVGGPDVDAAPEGTPCTVGELVGTCDGDTIGDGACAQCDAQNDCNVHPGGGRCFSGPGVCGCNFSGDCQGYWRAGSACVNDVGGENVCGCTNASHCAGNMHGDTCVGNRCGCADDGDCGGSPRGPTCVAGTATCGCTSNADCDRSPVGEVCLADDRCGCTSNAQCPQGSSCYQPLGFCVD